MLFATKISLETKILWLILVLELYIPDEPVACLLSTPPSLLVTPSVNRILYQLSNKPNHFFVNVLVTPPMIRILYHVSTKPNHFFVNVLVTPPISRILYHMSTKQTAFYQGFGGAIKEQNFVLCANQTKSLSINVWITP